MASRFTRLREFVEQEIEQRKAAPAGPMSPSQYWLDYNQYSSYVRCLPDEELRFIRRHTWHLTGDRYDFYHFISRRAKRDLISLYESLLPQLDGFRPQEPPDGIGVDTPHGRLNSGIVRYAQVLADLLATGLLPRSGTRRVLELGGGFGGLALMCLQWNPSLAYVLCDLEETLFFEGVFLSLHLGDARVHLARQAADLQALEPGHVYLLPQSRAAALEGPRFDVAINQQSMQEMTEAQVERYCQVLAKSAARFYSCNRRSHGAGVVQDKGLIADLHATLARRFPVEWDSTEHVSPLARLCLRNKMARKLITAFIGKSFLPRGEALLSRFVYRCGPSAPAS